MTSPALPSVGNPNELLALMLQLRSQQQDESQFVRRQNQQSEQFNTSTTQQQRQFEAAQSQQADQYNRSFANNQRIQQLNTFENLFEKFKGLTPDARVMMLGGYTEGQDMTAEQMLELGRAVSAIPASLQLIGEQAAAAGLAAMDPTQRARTEAEAASRSMSGLTTAGVNQSAVGADIAQRQLGMPDQLNQAAYTGLTAERERLDQGWMGLDMQKIQMLEQAANADAVAALSASRGISTEDFYKGMAAINQSLGNLANPETKNNAFVRGITAGSIVAVMKRMGLSMPASITEKRLADPDDMDVAAELAAVMSQYQAMGVPLGVGTPFESQETQQRRSQGGLRAPQGWQNQRQTPQTPVPPVPAAPAVPQPQPMFPQVAAPNPVADSLALMQMLQGLQQQVPTRLTPQQQQQVDMARLRMNGGYPR